MNRAERRRQEKAAVKDPILSLRRSEINAIKDKATNEAIDKAFGLMLGIPVMVLHDKHGYGSVRLERFMDQVMDLYESFNKGYLDFDDILKTIEDETGLRLEKTEG